MKEDGEFGLFYTSSGFEAKKIDKITEKRITAFRWLGSKFSIKTDRHPRQELVTTFELFEDAEIAQKEADKIYFSFRGEANRRIRAAKYDLDKKISSLISSIKTGPIMTKDEK